MSENYSISIAKKKIQMAVVEELYRKDVIDFCQYNHVIKSLEEEMFKLMKKLEDDDTDLQQLTFTKIL